MGNNNKSQCNKCNQCQFSNNNNKLLPIMLFKIISLFNKNAMNKKQCYRQTNQLRKNQLILPSHPKQCHPQKLLIGSHHGWSLLARNVNQSRLDGHIEYVK